MESSFAHPSFVENGQALRTQTAVARLPGSRLPCGLYSIWQRWMVP